MRSGGEFRRFLYIQEKQNPGASIKIMYNIHDTLNLHLEEKQYKDLIERYHFTREDLQRLKWLGKLAVKAAMPEMYCGIMDESSSDGEIKAPAAGSDGGIKAPAAGSGGAIREAGQLCDKHGGRAEDKRLAVIVTLGSGFDMLQERYMQRGRLSEGYMLECIGMELLCNAYEQTAERIYGRTGMWISGFDFLGDREPLSRMTEIFQKIQPREIQYNQAYMLTPKKTVIFLTDLCEKRKESYCHVCTDCGNMNCPNRKTEERITKMYQYILFDLDGTLTDPKPGITGCVQYALHRLGIEEHDRDRLEPFIGPPLLDSFREFYGMDDEKGRQAVAYYRERFSDVGLFENEIYPGIRQMLERLQKAGRHLAVASSKPTVFVTKILEHFGILDYFEVIVGSELDGTRAKKEEVVEEALRQLLGRELLEKASDGAADTMQWCDVVMVGDRKFDIEGAKAFQIASVGVSYGYAAAGELAAAGADVIVDTVEELERELL